MKEREGGRISKRENKYEREGGRENTSTGRFFLKNFFFLFRFCFFFLFVFFCSFVCLPLFCFIYLFFYAGNPHLNHLNRNNSVKNIAFTNLD